MDQPAKKSGTPLSIRDSLKKATTEMLVLHLLRGEPMYTYEMMTAIEKRSGGVITFNTLYQSIYRLQEFQYIREFSRVISDGNRVRIYFTITDAGQDYLNSLIQEYTAYTNSVSQILGLKREGAAAWNQSTG